MRFGWDPRNAESNFKKHRIHFAGGGNYQSLINAALREHVSRKIEPLEDTLRRVLREELDRSA